MGVVAVAFHFPPSELWEMEVGELLTWAGQAERLMKA